MAIEPGPQFTKVPTRFNHPGYNTWKAVNDGHTVNDLDHHQDMHHLLGYSGDSEGTPISGDALTKILKD